MARVVNEKEYEARRKEILDTAQRLVYTVGYDNMSIQNIVDELKISKGAFYHYFDSKPALLEALIEHMSGEISITILPIVEDPHLTALEKLHLFFQASSNWKSARKPFVLNLLKVWYTDENALVRQKTVASRGKYFIAMLTPVLQQGIREGVFDFPYPDQVGEVFLTLSIGLGDIFSQLLLREDFNAGTVQEIKDVVAAFMCTLERMLNVPPGTIQMLDEETLKEWSVPINGSLISTEKKDGLW